MKGEKFHIIEKVNIQQDTLSLVVDGSFIQRNLKDLSPRLANANKNEQQQFDISPSGYGIHWPLIDEDISIDALLGIVHQPDEYRKSA